MVRLHRVLRATPEHIYRAFLDAGLGHSSGGDYLELLPHQRIRYSATFDDPNLLGTMQTTVSLRAIFCATELNVVQEGIPAVIPTEACYEGWQKSLVLLAQRVEAEVRQ